MPVVSDGQTTVVRTVVAAEELTRGVTQAWLVLAGLGITLVLLGLLVADRLARTLVAPIAELSAVSHRLARAELDARADPAGPPEVREVTCCATSASRSPTCPTGSARRSPRCAWKPSHYVTRPTRRGSPRQPTAWNARSPR